MNLYARGCYLRVSVMNATREVQLNCRPNLRLQDEKPNRGSRGYMMNVSN